jgi:hypothetical protein
MLCLYQGAGHTTNQVISTHPATNRIIRTTRNPTAVIVCYSIPIYPSGKEASCMKEILIICGGVYMTLLIIFHLLFWRIFNWPETLAQLNKVNKSTIQVLNISITFIFFIIAYISFAHTEELLNTQLGRSLLALVSLLWLFRAVQQVVFYELKHRASAGLTLYFLVGALLYGIPTLI